MSSLELLKLHSRMVVLIVVGVSLLTSHCCTITNAFLSPLPATLSHHRQPPHLLSSEQDRLALLLVRTTTTTGGSGRINRPSREPVHQLYLFGDVFRRKNSDAEKDPNDDSDDDHKNNEDEEDLSSQNTNMANTSVDAMGDETEKSATDSPKKRLLPFFARSSSQPPNNDPEEDAAESEVVVVVELSAKEKAMEAAKSLKAQAERVRLEAEKLDVILSLDKVTKLEQELTSKAALKNPDRQKSIKTQINMLQKKLRGEETTTTIPSSSSTTPSEKDNSHETNVMDSSITTTSSSTTKDESDISLVDETMYDIKQEVLSKEQIEARVIKFRETPKFMQQIVARTAGIDFDDNLNVTSLIIQLDQDERDFLQGTGMSGDQQQQSKTPTFTDQEIEERANQLKNVPQFVKNLYGNDSQNDTAIALSMLENDWEEEQDKKPSNNNNNNNDDNTEKKKGFGSLFDRFNDQTTSDEDRMIETLFPKSTRKGDLEITEAQIKSIMADISKDKIWQSSAPPLKVSGGYIIRGTPKYENGDELIEAIDKQMARSTMGSKVSVFYVYDPTPVTEVQMESGLDRAPVLFVTGPDVARDTETLQRTAVTAVALATTWYTSLYPFLMNDKIMKLAEEQMALADASMPSDLTLLTDNSYPLFLAFLGTQIAHELGHKAVAAYYKMDVTVPTLVPSLVTGVTNSITSFKKPPKNRQQLLDFAIAGPLTGIAVSLLVLFYGLSATATMDAAAYGTLPALPLEFLRQSSLGGAIIEGVLGAGVLDLPDGATGTTAIANLNIPLHPFAIAGYIGLLVNTISLWPVGRTDGGRISMTLFGRSGTQLVGLLGLVVLIAGGFMNSDLFLFYFSYLAFFQSELEIPQRNEVDEVDFSRVLLATATGVLVVLTLVPM